MTILMGVVERRFVKAAFVIAVAALLSVATPSFRAAEPIPVALSDETFWRMIEDMSEPDGSFQFENFLSNELGYQYVIPRLLQATKPGGVYLGVAPEQNFTYIAALKPKIAMIIDIRRQNMIELMMYKALFEISETRTDFVSNLFARKRLEGLTEKSTADELFTAFSKVRRDDELYRRNLQTMQELLLRTHKFGLRSTDVAGRFSLEYEYEIFVDSGPSIDYSTGG